jgi:hypothetical protein
VLAPKRARHVVEAVGGLTGKQFTSLRSKHYKGFSCTDKVWGDLSKHIKRAGRIANYGQPGVYTRIFSCTNPAPWLCKATAVVEVEVIDTTPPVCTGKNSISLEASFPYTPSGAACKDSLDGAIRVTHAGEVDVEREGTYTVTYTATDKAGNAGHFVQTVKVVDTLKPVIGLDFGDKYLVKSKIGFRFPAGDLGINGEQNPIDTREDLLGFETLYPVRRLMEAKAVVQSGGWAMAAAALVVGAVVMAAVQRARHSATAHVPV